MAQVFSEITKYEQPECNNSPFTDVPTDSSVLTTYSAKITVGFEDNTFRPDADLTREQAAVITSRTLRACGIVVPVSENNPFTDEISDWAVDDVLVCTDTNIVNGASETEFGGDDIVTTEEADSIIRNAVEFITGIS